MFSDAEHAVRWAEYRLARSDIKSQMSSLQKKGQFGYGDLTADELDDIAQTVTHLATNIKPPKGIALLSVYGADNPSRNWALSDMMVLNSKILDFDAFENLSEDQIKSIMLCVIRDERCFSFNEPVTPKSHIYSVCNLNQYKYKKWRIAELRRLSQAMLRTWLEDAARQLEVELDAIDMLAR